MKLFAIIMLIGVGAIVALNTFVDAAGIGTYDRVYELASRQGAHELVDWQDLFDQRAWVKAKIERECPDVLILGSSTVGALRQEMFGDRRVLNAWLSAPTIEDFEALTVVLERAHCQPRSIVVGIDPWFANAAFGDQRWESLIDDYVAYQPTASRLRLRALAMVRAWDLFKERLNWGTTRASLAALWTRARSESPSLPRLVRAEPDELCATLTTPHYIRANDGHYVSCAAFVPSPAVVDDIARNYVAANTHEIRNWKEVDPERMRRLADVVKRWAAHSNVILVAPPYHPKAWSALQSNPTIAANLSTLDRELGALQGAHYINLRDPGVARCAATEFEDGHHGQPACARKLVEHLSQAL